MNRSRYGLLAGLLLTLAVPALAEQQTPPQGGSEETSHFQEHKADILKHMNEHLAAVQKRIACVQAASNHQSLRACMPERSERGEGPEGAQHGGMQHGGAPQGGMQEKPE